MPQPWIHRDDWIALVRWAIDTTSASGAINATAPHPVTNAEFTRALGRARCTGPPSLPAPAFALRIALGEMADALLLSGQNAVPAKAERLGFKFRYSHLDAALAAIFMRSVRPFSGPFFGRTSSASGGPATVRRNAT